jgi:hypothetical protein
VVYAVYRTCDRIKLLDLDLDRPERQGWDLGRVSYRNWRPLIAAGPPPG